MHNVQVLFDKIEKFNSGENEEEPSEGQTQPTAPIDQPTKKFPARSRSHRGLLFQTAVAALGAELKASKRGADSPHTSLYD